MTLSDDLTKLAARVAREEHGPTAQDRPVEQGEGSGVVEWRTEELG